MPNYRYQQGDKPLDGYTIQYALGRGGFGEVYFGISDSGRQVALKAVQNYEDVELRGISHCMNLKSPHLVTIFDVRRGEGGVPWVIMEYVSGPSLQEVLAEAGDSGIGEDQAMFFARELIKGLRYLHDAGVVHRDLKPHNVFFEDGTVKIGDYSLSKAISGTQQTGHTTAVGSVHYMAPEIGQGKYDKAVDIYALGVILYEMLTGQPPYVGQSMGEVLIKHLTSEPDVSKLSQPYADVIRTAMQREPDKRFESVDEMLQALCPTEHSSYLPPPTSLTMIGQRAAAKRANQNFVSTEQPSYVQSHSLSDTFLPVAELVDTKETMAGSDSVPFSRPGIPKYSLGWLSVLGLLWRPTGKTMTGQDALSLPWRITVVIFVIVSLLSLAVLCSDFSDESLVLATSVMPALVVIAGGLTWAMLQFLPRSPTIRWTVASRLVSVFLAFLSVGLLAVFLELLPFLGMLREYVRYDDAAIMFCLLMVFIDFRCFISADRYPRVGIVRTATVTVLFALLVFPDNVVFPDNGGSEELPTMTMLFASLVFPDNGGSEEIPTMLLASMIAVVISIQVLAPQHQEVVSQVNAGKKIKTTADHPTQAASDLEATNIKTDELEMQVIQKEGH